MTDLPENIRLISLDLFDAAFPVPLEDEEATKRRFMTLFEHEAHTRHGGNSTVSRVTNLYGETFALKRLHVAEAADSGSSEELDRAPVRKELRNRWGSAGARGGEVAAAGSSGAGTAGVSGSGDSFKGSATPDYVTRGHVSALYEEYRVHQTVSALRGFPKLYGFGIIGRDPVIIMEWVEGVLLRDCLKSRSSGRSSEGTADSGSSADADSAKPGGEDASLLPLDIVADFGIAVLSLLVRTAELDERFVHRDLSPRNIILRTDRLSADEQLASGEFDLCLIDFGSSALRMGADDPTFTQNRNIWRMGTPAYAPPEMLSADIELPKGWRQSETIDTYALCGILYELYSGARPFRFEPGESPYRAKTETAPVPLVEREPDGGALAGIITSGLSVQQEDRPSVAQLKAALENWKRLPAQRSIGPLRGARPTDAAFWQPGYARKAITRRSFVAASIVVVSALAAGAVAAPKVMGKVDAFDASRYSRADGPYVGEPLFKAYDARHPGWMLCTGDGAVACKPDSSRECGALREGLVALYDDISQRFGFIAPAIDGSGAYAWAILPSFSQVGDFSEGLAAAQDRVSGLWGFVDTAGNWAVVPQFRQAGAFSHGAAAVQANDTDALWGAIGKEGEWLIEPSFAALGSRSADGHAIAESAERDAASTSLGRWGIVDASGIWSCAERFARLRSCAKGPAPALDAASGLWGFAAPDGAWTVEPRFLDARPFHPRSSAGVAADGVLAAVQDASSQLWYFVDEGGSPHQGMEPRFWKLGDLHDGLAPAQASADDDTVVFDGAAAPARVRGAGMRYGYVDEAGEWHMKRLTTLVDTAIGPAAI